MSDAEVLNGFLIFLVIFLFIPLGILTIIGIISFIVRSKNRKYREFVLSNSQRVKEILELNKQFNFLKYKTDHLFYKKFDSRSSWNRMNPDTYFIKNIKYDLKGWTNLKRAIDYNREKYREYIEKIKLIRSRISKETCEKNKKRYKKCVDIEDKVAEATLLKPDTDITIKVRLRYVSPAGRVDESNYGKYNYYDLTRIIGPTHKVQDAKEVVTKAQTQKEEKVYIPVDLKYEVMKHDGFRCALCGSSRDDGVMLQVDYITPISKGGRSEIENLRTLCDRCYQEVHNKIE